MHLYNFNNIAYVLEKFGSLNRQIKKVSDHTIAGNR